jgi:hypothetical protein
MVRNRVLWMKLMRNNIQKCKMPAANNAANNVEAVATTAKLTSKIVRLDQNFISFRSSIRWSSLFITLSKRSFEMLLRS